MGVRNLWKILEPCAKKAEFKNKTLAVDTSIWMHHYKSIPDNMVVFSISKRIFKILYNKIQPVFVFDGKPPAAKKETVEKRKQNELKSLIRKIVLNKRCSKCGELLKVCRHINDFDEPELKKLDEEAINKLKHHNYNWGELSSETNDIVEDGKYESVIDNGQQYVDSSISNFDYESIRNLSKQQQLEKLIDLRSKRKLPMVFDNSDFSSFCESQLENVKKRNKITSLIRNLNKDARKTIQSDWTGYSELRKDEVNIFKAFYYKEEEEEQHNHSKERSESSEVERLFEKHQSDGWDDVFEKYAIHSLKSTECDVKRQANFNLALLNTVNDASSTVLSNHRMVHEQNCIRDEMEIRNLSSLDDAGIGVKFCGLKEYIREGIVEDNVSKEDICESSVDAADYFDDSNDDYAHHSFEREYGPSANSIECDLSISNNDLQRVQRLIIELLDILELPHIECIGETDAQCGYLFRKRLIDGVVSEDNDMVLHGVTVYKNFFRKDKDILSFSYQDVIEQLGLDQDSLIKMSYLLGSDYCIGVKRVGIKSVFDRLKDVSEAEVLFLKAIYTDENVKKVDKVVFGSLNIDKFRHYLLAKGFEQHKIDELLLYCKKIMENCKPEY
ncbi:uncharacterized protein VICG_00999 [Vittaforma corneae ATCC 50505]|uniref:XPG N-terminal domain-containing protein n=1 Tax=Vittaforma corneae (strain ATCC 50505) TaxID=993615 RepID=L2GNT3_VITCO|nr:uncharacterized protein VICG_00999 [Vittaforma corneae ATCC 50505]ELA41982.1 hypothetical protein VICG_00999 [Vittaforma corneae ATCC 50505]